MKTLVGITRSQQRTDHKPLELPNTQFAGSKKVPLLFCFRKMSGEAMGCFRCLRNIQDKLADRKSLCEKRNGIPFDGPVTPLWAEIYVHRISAKDKSRLHQFGTRCSQEYSSDTRCILEEVGLET